MTEKVRPRIIPTPKQREAIRVIKAGIRYILTGGAISTAKSYGLAQIFISMAMQFPRTRYGIFRKNLTVLKRTTYQTFRKVAYEYGLVEGQHYKVNRSEMYWEFTNGTQIFFLELDETKDPDFNKVKGLELTAAGIDEMNEVVKEGWLIVGSRVGRENRNGEPQFVLGTCNPADNWVKDTFYTPWIKGTLPDDFAFIPSLPKDNPHNSKDYLDALDRMPPQFKKRYVEGNWDYVDDSNALFPNHVIDRMLVENVPKNGLKTIGVDVSREGSDKTVFSLFISDTLADLYEPDVDRGDTAPISDLIADELILYMKKNEVGYQQVWIDAVGNGGGVVDSMRRRGYFVNSFKSGEKTTDLHEDGTPKYDMLRSERYYKMAQAGQQGTLKIWKHCPFLEELRRDLLAHTYEVTDKQFIVESKSKMKKRLGRSPDISDAVVMGWREAVPEGANEISTGGSWDDLYKDSDEDF
jgi:phage terminase large subunit